MRSFADMPIKQKLIRVIMLTSGVALSIISVAVFIHETYSFRQVIERLSITRARVIAAMSTAAVQFDDPEAAVEILSASRVDPNFIAAAVFKDGTLFASYPANIFEGEPLPDLSVSRNYVEKGALVRIEPIFFENRVLGTVYLKLSLKAVYDRLTFFAVLLFIVVVGAASIAYLLATLLQRGISDPILELASTVRAVSERKDYSLRAKRLGADELGLLTDAFNDMLKEIHRRDVALLESSRRLALALEASHTGTWDRDLTSDRMVWDLYTEALFGLKPGMFDQTYEGFLARVHPEDRDRVAAGAERAIERKRELDLEIRVVWPDGSVHYMIVRGRAFYDERGHPLRMTGVCLDVTEKKLAEQAIRESEERMRSVVDHVVDGIITIDSQGRIESFNPAAAKIFGYSAQEVMGCNVNMLMPEPYHSEHDDYIANYLETGQRKIIGIGREVAGRRKDGSVFPMELAVSEFHLGERRYFTGIVRDITERKRAEEEIRRLNAELEQRVVSRTAELAATNRELEAFTYSVSHDLRAPLRHIDGYAQILIEEHSTDLSPAALHYLRRIRRGTQNMGRLVDDLLNFARVGRLELKHQPVDLNDILEEVISDLRPEIQQRQIEWKIGRLPVCECDPGLMKQVFTNLLSNAIKYTRPREMALIEVFESKRGNDFAIGVRDNGVGFDMKYADKLFGVFQRLHRADEFEGTGVGLATVQRIIQRHGGRIWAESELGRGAVFWFTLPGCVRS